MYVSRCLISEIVGLIPQVTPGAMTMGFCYETYLNVRRKTR